VVEVAYVDGERCKRVHASCSMDVPCNRWRSSRLGDMPSREDGVVERRCSRTERAGKIVWMVLSIID
jgi:hypothetical protein